MNKRMIIACVALVCCATLALGCNKGPKKVHITGTVTVNGETVDQGAITFIAKDGSGLRDGGKIIDGAYEADVTTGEKTVQVYGAKKTGNKIKPDPTLNPDLEVDEVPGRRRFLRRRRRVIGTAIPALESQRASAQVAFVLFLFTIARDLDWERARRWVNLDK